MISDVRSHMRKFLVSGSHPAIVSFGTEFASSSTWPKPFPRSTNCSRSAEGIRTQFALKNLRIDLWHRAIQNQSLDIAAEKLWWPPKSSVAEIPHSTAINITDHTMSALLDHDVSCLVHGVHRVLPERVCSRGLCHPTMCRKRVVCMALSSEHNWRRSQGTMTFSSW